MLLHRSQALTGRRVTAASFGSAALGAHRTLWQMLRSKPLAEELLKASQLSRATLQQGAQRAVGSARPGELHPDVRTEQRKRFPEARAREIVLGNGNKVAL